MPLGDQGEDPFGEEEVRLRPHRLQKHLHRARHLRLLETVPHFVIYEELKKKWTESGYRDSFSEELCIYEVARTRLR